MMYPTTQYILRCRQRTARQYREELSDGVTLEMVWIPGGTFLMGAPEGVGNHEEHPQHDVTVPDFFLGKYPVTQAQWQAVATGLPKVKCDLEPDPAYFQGDERPVESISWFQAVEFCQRLAQKTGRPYRLPSEAEWEYACRAEATTPYHFGETITPEVANFKRLDAEETTVAGRYRLANAFGLYDMHGNVWEWCYDQWHGSYDGAPTDGSPWIDDDRDGRKSRVRRGGSWLNTPWDCRSTHRVRLEPVCRSYYDGFRLCCSVPQIHGD
ncbi:serine/threonine kinase [Geitlerinema sp. FC II]|nr:formylglycine-generating enzyme family protein [Geitlerinema sp. CS-897]PPT08943.1 serine/threonine kinase [Geitlerinema sp. FC II]